MEALATIRGSAATERIRVVLLVAGGHPGSAYRALEFRRR